MAGTYCYSESKTTDYVFSVGPQFGFIYGKALEAVYPLPEDTKGELLSELRWDIKPVYYIGIQLDYGLRDLMKESGFFSSLSFKAGIPKNSGIMEDRDWLSIENNSLTNFSSHTNKTRQFFNVDVSFGASLPVKTYFYFKPLLSGRWMRFAFSGRDGYGKYARDKVKNIFGSSGTYFLIEDNPDTVSFEGKEVIRYKQDWLTLSPGISVGTMFINNFTFDLSFLISLFNLCYARDEHVIRDKTFLDIIPGGFFLEPAFSITFSVKQMDIYFDVSYRQIGKNKGNTYTKQNNGTYQIALNGAGSGLFLIDSRFLVKIRF